MTVSGRPERRLGPAPARVESLTGLRWWAAAAVFCFHSPYFAPMPALNGNSHRYKLFAGVTGLGFAGVSFFFVLSGFVLTWSYTSGDSPARFWWRRFARIWPMVPFSTLLYFAVFFDGAHVYWAGLRDTLLLRQAWDDKTYYKANGATWSLSCEAFFYLLFPVLIRVVDRLSLRMIGVVGVATLAIVATAPPVQTVAHPTGGSPLQRLPEFVLGIVAAAAVRRGWRPPVGVGASLALIAGAGAFIVWWFAHPALAGGSAPFPVLRDWPWTGRAGRITVFAPQYVMDQALAPLFALCISAVAARDAAGGRSRLRHPVMVLLGKWSYSFYLVESTVLNALARWPGQRPPQTLANLPWLVLALLLAVWVSAVCFYGIEQPCQRWLNRLLPAAGGRGHAALPEQPAPQDVVPAARDLTTAGSPED